MTLIKGLLNNEN